MDTQPSIQSDSLDEKYIIKLPESKKGIFQKKLEEYKKRLQDYSKYDITSDGMLDVTCKIIVLESLIETGEVSNFILTRELRHNNIFKSYPKDRIKNRFENAFGVIRNYVESSGRKVFGGTGVLFPDRD